MPFIKSPLINSNCLLLVLSYQHLLQNVNSVGLKASWVFSVSWCQPLLCGVSNPVDFNRCDMQTYVVSFLYSKPSCPYFHKMHHHWSVVLSWGGLFFQSKAEVCSFMFAWHAVVDLPKTSVSRLCLGHVKTNIQLCSVWDISSIRITGILNFCLG